MNTPVYRHLCRRALLAFLPLVFVAACTTPPPPMLAFNPLQVNVASVDRIPGAALEVRLNARLRIQNPNDQPVYFNGASVELRLNGATIGTGVTNATTQIPRFGSLMVDVPVTVSGLAEIRRAVGSYGAPDRKLDVVLKGWLAGSNHIDPGFEWRGELALAQP